ncbi:Putative multicopper oxidase, type 1, multicopper oxidase, copper-binding, cupredoxin [Septoria linicola]|uniref:Multicopper oxidase, type 1, multicopper oxidase, copper-binding, cupredoxin n=1 Tax=Septoria linicola TaxID=215465 RepID=A0A9Q9EKN5_9PEZI|nr:putative multicopper oxidase, type 1, multicopper oxidase, copper-binding, cupredoxin [Septoria linicola]USW53459.1 Putative multicopper oxidase, type 1, multicopper oxidase, copper-binding, cupredoxin [Septoria linicola]
MASFKLISGLLVSSLASLAVAETRTFDWNITWVNRNPDGLHERPVIGINNEWPIPHVNITKGDRVVVNMHNQLGNQSTSLHFHGLFQNGTNEMDGPVGVTQCDVPPGSSFTYNFTIDQPGTYWYHSHSRGQYPDGLRGQFVVNDPENPYLGQYDEEVGLTISDWYHDQMPGLLDWFISVENPTGAEPVPKTALMNDTQNLTIPVEPNKTYFFRLSNVAAFSSQYFWIEGHTMRIIEVDGVYTEPADAEMIYVTAAQRYGFLVTTKNDTSAGNFAIVSSMDTDLFDAFPADLPTNVTGWLMYDETKNKPEPALLDSWDAQFDDFDLVPQDGLEILDKVDYSFNLDLSMNNLGNGANYAWFNDITYVRPKVPTLYSALTTGEYANNATVYGRDTNSFVLNKDDVIEIILNNDDPGKHPFHLHGHNFQVVYRSPDEWGFYDPANHTDFPQKPMRRDTFWVRPNGNFVIRFKADNPGIWLFHCHLEWHLASGLVATMVEAPLEIQKTITIPQDHYDACAAAASPTPTAGNAAANTKDVLNLEGQNLSIAPLPSGFTARGIVALVFSCIAAFLGMAAIAWYGAAPLSATEMAQTRQFVAKAGGSTT